jgi:hypothetical protein
MSSKVVIDNRDLAYTIDTYAMFQNNNDEYIVENLQDEYPDITWDDIDWEYHHPEYVNNLAHASINILHNALVLHGDGIVQAIDFVKSGSPQFYNYTTDWYTAEWTIDVEKLRAWIARNELEYENFVSESQWSSVEPGSDDEVVRMLDFYTIFTYDPEEYESTMYEVIGEAGDVIEYSINKEYKGAK